MFRSQVIASRIISISNLLFFKNFKQVFKAGGRPSDKSQGVVDNILRYFPDFDAFPLSPPSSEADVIQHLSDEGRQGEINSSFLKGVEDFKQMLRAKLTPKQSFSGPGLVTGQGWLLTYSPQKTVWFLLFHSLTMHLPTHVSTSFQHLN